MNSSITFNIFKVRPSAVVSSWKSIAQITFGRIGDIAPTATPIPVKRFFLRRCGTRRPSSRHSRRMRLLLTFQRLGRAILAARRHPQRGRSVENRRSQTRNSASCAVTGNGLEAHRGTVDAHHRAGSAFGHPEPVAQHLDGAALAVRGQKFPAEISLSMSMSRAWLATNFFNRAFSASSSLSCFALAGFHAAVLGKPAMPRRLSDLQVPAHLGEFLARREEFVALGELADDLIRRMPPALL